MNSVAESVKQALEFQIQYLEVIEQTHQVIMAKQAITSAIYWLNQPVKDWLNTTPPKAA